MTKFLDGFYKAVNHFYNFLQVEDGNLTTIDGMGNRFTMTAEFGDFGETYSEVKEQTGADTYNVRFRFIWTEEMGEGFREMAETFIEHGVLSQDGMNCVIKGVIGVSELVKITE